MEHNEILILNQLMNDASSNYMNFLIIRINVEEVLLINSISA